MLSFCRLISVLLALFFSSCLITPLYGASVDVLQIDVNGAVDAGTRHSVLSRLRTVPERDTDLVVLRIHSSGGRIDFALDLSDALQRISVPVVAYVRRRAGAVAALLCVSSDRVYMQEGAVLGAGHPTRAVGGRSFGRSQMVDRLRTIYVRRARASGYPESFVAALVDPAVELRWVETVNGTRTLMSGEQFRVAKARGVSSLDVVSASGRLLRIRAGDAFRFGFSEKVVKRLIQVVEAEVHRSGRAQYQLSSIARAWYEPVLQAISRPLVSGLFIALGLAAALIELNSPGVGIVGSIAPCSLGTVMFTFAVLDVAGGVALVIFLVGLLLYTLDVTLIPEPASTGILGVFVVLFALIFAGQGFVLPEVRAAPWEIEYALDGFGTVLLSSGLGVLGYLVTMQLLPDHVFDVAVVCLSRASDDTRNGEGARSDLRTGDRGVVEHALRPLGTLQFDDGHVTAFTEGAFVNRGVRVEVVDVRQDGRVVLRPL